MSPKLGAMPELRVRNADGRGPCRRLWAMNLSTGGMFIRTADPLPAGARVRVEVEWAASVVPLGEGEFVWRRTMGNAHAPGFGLRFTLVEPESKSLLDLLVKHGGASAVFRPTALEALRR